jgi:hypothetical protein
MITNINTGVCHRRAQENKPSFFVNWQENGKQQYFFSQFMFAIERQEQRLKQLQAQEAHQQNKINNFLETGKYY